MTNSASTATVHMQPLGDSPLGWLIRCPDQPPHVLQIAGQASHRRLPLPGAEPCQLKTTTPEVVALGASDGADRGVILTVGGRSYCVTRGRVEACELQPPKYLGAPPVACAPPPADAPACTDGTCEIMFHRGEVANVDTDTPGSEHRIAKVRKQVGLVEGDIITKVNGVDVVGMDHDSVVRLWKCAPTVTLTVERDDEQREVTDIRNLVLPRNPKTHIAGFHIATDPQERWSRAIAIRPNCATLGLREDDAILAVDGKPMPTNDHDAVLDATTGTAPLHIRVGRVPDQESWSPSVRAARTTQPRRGWCWVSRTKRRPASATL